MKKWEYNVELTGCSSNKVVFQEWLNEIGKNGWELAGIQWGDASCYTVWKREIVAGNKYTQEQIDAQIQDAKRVLMELQVPEMFLNKMCCLTFLALCNIVPGASWFFSTNEYMGLTKDIMEFIAENYSMQYKSGTRESFRKEGINVLEGINILMRFNIIDINPGDPNLGPNSPKVHYAIKESILTQIKKL